MRILLNIWPLNGIRASKSLPLFTIIKRRWSFLTLQIHLLFVPLCLAVSITWHAKRTLFSWQMQKGNDLLPIYLFTLHLSPSNPPHLHHCTEGRFFNFLHENNAIAFLASPAKQAPAAHGDRWPPIITECLIDPGRAECAVRASVFVREGEHAEASHIRHACNVCWSQVNAFPPSPLWCLLARWPWGLLDEWLSLHICTLPPDTQV